MLPRIKYLEVASILAKQKEVSTIFCSLLANLRPNLSKSLQVILAKIRLLSQSHVIHPGLDFFSNAPPGSKIDHTRVPGLKESGWTPEMDELYMALTRVSLLDSTLTHAPMYRTRRPKRGPQFAVMKKLLTLLVDHPSSWAFANPVNEQEVKPPSSL